MGKKKGCLIFIEGVDKSGKGTQWALVSYALKAEGYDVEAHTFPDYSTLPGVLVDLALRSDFQNLISDEVVATNYAADRAYHIKPIINALDMGRIVICKRSPWSNAAYRVGLKGLNVEKVIGLDSFFPSPNIALFLDISESIRELRQESFGKEADSLEAMNQDPVRDLYLRMHDKEDKNFNSLFPSDYKIVLDASGGIKTTLADILSKIEPLLGNFELSRNASLRVIGKQEPANLNQLYRMRFKDIIENFIFWKPVAEDVRSINELVDKMGLDLDQKTIMDIL